MSDARAVSDRLHRAVAAIGGELAALLDASSARTSASVVDALGFLLHADEEARGQTSDHPTVDPIDRLVGGLGLSDAERTLLLIAGMSDEHEGYSAVLRALHPRGEPRATLGLAAQLLARQGVERLDLLKLTEEGALFSSGAVALSGDGASFERSLVPMEALWPALHGIDAWPRALRSLPLEVSDAGLSNWLDSESVTRVERALCERDRRLILVTADSEDIALHRALAICEHTYLDAIAVAAWVPERIELEQALAVHSMVRATVPVIRISGGESGATVMPELATYNGPFVVAARRGAVRPRGVTPVLHLDIERVSVGSRRSTWREMLPELETSADTLGTRYTLDPAQIADVVRDVRSLDALTDDQLMFDTIARSVRARSQLALPSGIELRRATAAAEALVLPPDRRALLEEAIDRLRYQRQVLEDWGFLRDRAGARGVRMLFSGPPGTGKTLAAEVMAAALGVDLLVVDIPRVVSKWIGETEKNLAEVFDAAERAQAVLLFDEADAFFGRRTEISDAHDRYANFETAYLLSRLERFEGLAILATNLRQNIDTAFMRRLEFLVEFDEPAAAERAAIWRCHLPAGASIAPDVRIPELAALYAIVGGLIRNAAVAAAFLAAAEGTHVIAQRHFLRAIAREYEKSGKAFPGLPSGAAVCA